ncbi:tyrosinase [Crepidotus variabilis]|uniref:tyrosinase n=1 Tax=Crepidotus variabilis TaxID=179855 RepID=A0A9P6ELV7_9AGAR|nr:tyrosinase [Crepidotus variabilis]
MSRVVITGPSGGAPNRLEINTFVKNDKFFSLYIQALQAISTTDQANVQSFFQIGGIHGLPYVPWNGATGSKPFDPNTTWGGYCTHGSVLFPTWHRPYLMLYEQIIQAQAVRIAATYTVDQAAWKQAANDLRQPYWDWAANSVPPAEVISSKQVSITGPDGKKHTVDNPLYHYTFHPVDPSFPAPYRNWKTTLRWPNNSTSSATDNVTRLQSILKSAQSDIKSSTYSMLTRVHTWTAFSNHTVGDGGSSSNSIEAIHDGIHVNVGGNGQMSDPSVAAFDPIFFLHHTNVDRLTSLWSALNPGVWVSKGDSEDGTFTMGPEIPVDVNTPLTPFWNNQSSTTFWASSATQDTSKLGYTYPEFNGLDMGNPQTVQTAIGQKVNQLYGSSVFGNLNSALSGMLAATNKPQAERVAASSAPAPATAAHTASVETEKKPAALPASALFANPAQQPLPAAGHPQPDQGHHSSPGPVHPPDQGLFDWTARIEFKKYELGCSFSVLLFLGAPPEDPEQWLVSPNYVGGHHAFVNTAAGHCANCRGQGDLLEEGFVHLNEPIVQHSGLHSLDPSAIEPYLTSALHWRVQKMDGTPAQLESLEVSVYATPLSYPPGTMFPVPGERRRHNGITHGRRGGSRQALHG